MPMVAKLPDLDVARSRLEGRVARTPLLPSAVLSEACGVEVWLKAENLQTTGSFKVRGATNKLLRLRDEGTRGVIAASAGNHARAVAYAARALEMRCAVLMPEWASPQKVRNTERLGAEVDLVGASLEAATAEARRRGEAEGLAFVHPYDDWDVIAGQATLGLDLLDDLPTLSTVVVPIGGGGLCGGILAALRTRGSTARVVGVRCTPDATLPDGIRVKEPGGRPSVLLQDVERAAPVDDAAVAGAMTLLLEEHALLAEGAGAAAVAALLDSCAKGQRYEGPLVVVVSGGNVDLSLLEKAVDYGLGASGRLAQLHLRIPDRPGALAERLGRIGQLGANIRSIEHERGEVGLPPGITVAVVTVETRGPEHLEQVRKAAEEVD